jgi:nitrite reductase (NADH) large subunit
VNVVIIGNGPAGNNIASKLDTEGVKVDLYSNEEVSFYSRIRLPSCIGNKDKLYSLCAQNEPSYIHHEAVVAIHRESKTILLADGQSKHYDKLVIATGSNPLVFFNNSGLEGIYTLRNFCDAIKITDDLVSPVCIMGGGLLGLETALEINKLNHKVTVVQGDAYVLNKQLNEEAAKIVSDKCEERENLDIICNQFAKSVEGNKRIEKLILQNGTVLECNTLILAAGVKPSISLAKGCGLEISKAIVINEYCQTSDKSIYAVGDCAEFNNDCPGLLPIALSTANVCVNHILGKKIPYVAPTQLPTRFQADDLLVASFGEMRGECHSKRVEDRYEAWYIEDKKVAGVILIGSKSHLPLAKASLNKEVEDVNVLLDF